MLICTLVLLVGCTSEHRPAPATSTHSVDELSASIDPVLHQLDHTGAIVSARVIDLSTGQELYSSHADDPFTPASNMKLQTSSAALDRLGADHVFTTYLAMDGDDLWLIGSGDPACGDSKIEAKFHRTTMSMLDDLADALKSRGMTNIKGNLYFYDGAFDTELVNKTWSRSFLTDWYAAPVSGLNFNDNCIDVTVYPTKPGEPARLEVIPPTLGNKLINQTRTAGAGEKATVAIVRDRDSNEFTIKGIVTEKKALESKPVTDPGAFFADALRTDLASHGIVIAGKTVRANARVDIRTWPADKIIAVHETKFTDILARLNKNSQNLFAEALSKYQGRAYAMSQGKDWPGSWQLGETSVRAFLKKNHIDDSKLVYIDGSGLARGNKVTTRLITDELAVMWKHPDHETFFNSLAVAGKDGTIGRRMDDLEGHVFGKTGYINGVRALSGYIKTRDNQWLAFSIIFNKLPGSVAPAEDVQDNICRMLVEYPHVEKAILRPIRAATTQAD